MDRQEALRILGLDRDASSEAIKIVYRETVQILHPDRFAGNKKLQERATEQFKNLQAAYDLLISGKGCTSSVSSSSGTAGTSRSSDMSRQEEELRARLAGIAAARVQLVEQRDSFLDRRRNAAAMMGIGALVAFFFRRFVWLAGVAGVAVVWGLIDVVSTTSNINSLTERLNALAKEKQQILSELEEIG